MAPTGWNGTRTGPCTEHVAVRLRDACRRSPQCANAQSSVTRRRIYGTRRAEPSRATVESVSRRGVSDQSSERESAQ